MSTLAFVHVGEVDKTTLCTVVQSMSKILCTAAEFQKVLC